MDEVIINGRRYVPSPSEADTVKFYFMHDWHGFSRLRGATLDEVVAHADQIEASAVGSYGMLCPAILMSGEKEVRRVGPSAHARGTKDPKDHWSEEKAKWIEAMKADADVMRLLPSNAELKGVAALIVVGLDGAWLMGWLP